MGLLKTLGHPPPLQNYVNTTICKLYVIFLDSKHKQNGGFTQEIVQNTSEKDWKLKRMNYWSNLKKSKELKIKNILRGFNT